jgi:hypothetical protein
MSWAYVQTAAGGADSSGSSIATAAFSGSVTSGSAFSYFVTYNNTIEVTVELARSTDVFTEVGHYFDVVSGYGLRWGYCFNASSGTGAVTATYGIIAVPITVPNWRGLVVTEFSGLATSSDIFAAGEYAGAYRAGVGTGTDAWSTGDITPGVQPALMVGLCEDINGGVLSAGTGFTDRGVPTTYGYGGSFVRLVTKNVTSTSAQPCTWTDDTASGFGLTGAIILREPTVAVVRRLTLLGAG